MSGYFCWGNEIAADFDAVQVEDAHDEVATAVVAHDLILADGVVRLHLAVAARLRRGRDERDVGGRLDQLEETGSVRRGGGVAGGLQRQRVAYVVGIVNRDDILGQQLVAELDDALRIVDRIVLAGDAGEGTCP